VEWSSEEGGPELVADLVVLTSPEAASIAGSDNELLETGICPACHPAYRIVNEVNAVSFSLL
jgi:hypothetical protein